MDRVTLLTEAREKGLEVRAEGNRLVIEGPVSLEPLANRLIAEKPVILALLGANDPNVVRRIKAMQARAEGKGPLPLLTSCDLPHDTAGSCVSCGDSLTEGRALRCQPCTHAAWLLCLELEKTVIGP